MEYFALTDIGSYRDKNQDAYYAGTNLEGDFLGVVCDGIGGGRAGEVASNKAIEYIEKNFPTSGNFDNFDEVKEYAVYLVKKASEYVYDLSVTNYDYFGMGTTITGVFISKYGTLTINIGDSRVYGIKKKKIKQLTDDDSLVNEMLKNGEISSEEAKNHPKKHCILKAIGLYASVEPKIEVCSGYDYYIVCSDGVHGFVPDSKMLEVVSNKDDSLEDKCHELLSLSLLAGGYDNITVVLVSCR